jgi:hypothetical protein
VVKAEQLDHLAPGDPAAQRSRRDLLRLHWAMGTRGIVARGWRALVPTAHEGPPLRLLELGAGDGRWLLGVARTVAPHWPQVQLTLLDRQRIVSPATLAGFAALGWVVRVQVADALLWASRHQRAGPRRPVPRWDLVSTGLFLHHFETADLALLLGAVALCADRFFACEPRRSGLALAGSHLVGALGASAVTRNDAVASVHAGFCGDEIATRWPQTSGHWQMQERAAGLFSHSFSARRT